MSYHHRTEALLHRWRGKRLVYSLEMTEMRSLHVCTTAAQPSSAGNSIRMKYNVTWRTFGHTSYTAIHCYTLLPEIINCQWMGSRLERCNILTSDLAFRSIAGPLLPVERSRTLDNFCQGTVGKDINSVISYQVIKAP